MRTVYVMASDGSNFRKCWCRICQGMGGFVNRKTIYKHLKKYGEALEDLQSSEADYFELNHDEPQDIFENQFSENDEIIDDIENVQHATESDDFSDSERIGNTSEAECSSANEDEDPSGSSEEDEFEQASNDAVKCSSQQCWNFTYDKSLYSTGLATRKLNGSEHDMTILQWLALNFYLFTSHPGTSKSSFGANLKLQRSMQAKGIGELLPSSYKEARKMVDPYLVRKVVYSACPNDCIVYRNSEKYSYKDLSVCPVCNQERYYNSKAKKPVSKKKFSYIPLSPRIARIYGEANLAQIVQSHPGNANEILTKGMEMWDVHDSPSWKNLYSDTGYFLGDKMGLSFALELDGVNPFHNIGVMYSMTPMMLTLLNFPRHIRNAFGNIFLVGIIPGKKQSEASNLDPYVEILVDELIYLSGCTAYSEYNKSPLTVKIKLLLYILDYPGFSKLFHQLGSGALAGCHWCHIRGVHCKHLDKVVYLSNRSYLKKDDKLRNDTFSFCDKCEENSPKPKLRSTESERDYREAYENAKNKTQAATVATATGCKGRYALSGVPGHNRLEQTQPDACHTLKDVIQNIVYLIKGKNIDLSKIVSAEQAYGRLKFAAESVNSDYGIKSKKRKKNIAPRGQKIKKSNNSGSGTTNQQSQDTDMEVDGSNTSPCTYKLPFLLTKEELTKADGRAEKIRVPVGFGLKPSRFISKTGSLKSHDWKQLGTQGILKFCLRGTLGALQRQTLFQLFDCFEDLCSESQSQDYLDELEEKLNHSLVLLERDFPVVLQNITTHILHHIIQGIRQYGPVYGTWMFVFERFNSWICKHALNMRYPESTAIETYLIYDWCSFMLMTGKLNGVYYLNLEVSCTSDLEINDIDESCETGFLPAINSSILGASKPIKLQPKSVQAIHRQCNGIESCEGCEIEKHFYHQETDSATKRTITYSCVQKEKVSNKSFSSYVCCELLKGPLDTKVESGKFIRFGQIQYFITHKNSDSCKQYLAYLGLFDHPEFDEETRLWFVKSDKIVKYCYILISKLSKPLVTGYEDNSVWFCNSGKKPYNSRS